MIKEFDFLVIGSGIAGMSFALKVAHKGNVALICKTKIIASGVGHFNHLPVNSLDHPAIRSFVGLYRGSVPGLGVAYAVFRPKRGSENGKYTLCKFHFSPGLVENSVENVNNPPVFGEKTPVESVKTHFRPVFSPLFRY